MSAGVRVVELLWRLTDVGSRATSLPMFGHVDC
jgi:hypothetical protein